MKEISIHEININPATATVFIRPQRYTKEFSDRESENYPKKDFHEMYVGEIIKIFRREDV